MSKKSGFTLVEMLVATALVVLMMLMFAQIFQVASGLVSNQKGMAELDQNVRTLTILLRGDMKSRTFVDVVPFQAGQDTTVGGPKYIPQKRRGFFSIAENNPDDTTDDVLHLTITTETESNQSLSQSPMLPYAGRASFMFTGTTAPADQNQHNQCSIPRWPKRRNCRGLGKRESSLVCAEHRMGSQARLFRD